MLWFMLVLAGLFETGWAVGLKYTHGFTRLWPSVGTVAAMVASFLLLAHAMKTLPVGTAYAVWTGIGTAGAFIAGVFLFGETVSLPRLLFLAMILVGIAGLKGFSYAGASCPVSGRMAERPVRDPCFRFREGCCR